MKMSSHLKAELAATCSTLGHLHKGNYLLEPDCFQSVKDLIHYLKRDNEMHEIRRYLGESKVLQNDLIQIIKSCPKDNSDLFGATLRLLINLTTPALLFYGENIPVEKIQRNIYLSLIGYSQDYKVAFCDVEFWNKICEKLTDLFETEWTDRPADDGIQIERILMLLRNVLQVPADLENEKRPENDVTAHDKILWTLKESQILELLLFITADKNEEQYYLNLLEIFSLILREQNPKLLASCDIQRSADEKAKDTEDLIKVRESEKMNRRNKYLNMRNFSATFVMKGVKSLSNRDIVCHKSLEKVSELELNNLEKKQIRARRSQVPVESDLVERRSTFFVRLFLKEFCLEFLNCSFKHLMNIVKNKLDSGKTLANDQTYYFWALKFFLDFATATNSDVDVLKDILSSESFHFVQTNMENAFEHLIADKNKTVNWVKRIHLILKAYRSLLETLLWMDRSSSALTRSMSRAIKSQIFYVVEYREMTLHVMLRYDPTKFSLSYLRDLIETTHLFVKLLEDYSKQVKLVVQRITKKKKKKASRKKRKNIEKEKNETREEKWEKIKDDVYDTLCSETTFPEIPPFDAALDIAIDDQKGRAMKTIQEFLHAGRIKDGIGLLRSARLVWPENDFFGFKEMSVENETMALQEICLADLEQLEGGNSKKVSEQPAEEEDEDEDEDEDVKENEDSEDACRTRIVEQDFDIMDYKKRLVNKRIIEGCGILLRNYKKNSDHTNHCVIKLLHRIGWECCMPAMLFQASIFWTLLKIMKDKSGNYNEIHTFAVHLFRKFRKHATKNPVVFLELLFWKDHNVALEIQHGYEPYGASSNTSTSKKKQKTKGKLRCDGKERVSKKARKKINSEFLETDQTEPNTYGPTVEDKENSVRLCIKDKKNKKGKKGKGQSQEGGSERDPNSLIPVNVLNDRFEDEIVASSSSHEDVNTCTLDVEEEDDDESDTNNLSNEKRTVSKGESSKKEAEGGQREIVEAAKSHIDRKAGTAAIDEDNAGDRNCSPEKKIFKRLRGTYKVPKSEKEAESKEHKNCKLAPKKSKFTFSSSSSSSSSSEDESTTWETNARLKASHETIEQAAPVRDSSSQENENDYGSIIHTSSSFIRKRQGVNKEETRGILEGSYEINISKRSKRSRFISSDSDTEVFEEVADAGPGFGSRGSKKRKRLTVIDSDSDSDADADVNSLDANCC